MYNKTLIWIGLFVGSTVGGFIPSFWGADVFSLWPVVLSAVGGLLGIWVGVKLSDYF